MTVLTAAQAARIPPPPRPTAQPMVRWQTVAGVEHGHRTVSGYVRDWWTPVIGPTGTAVLRLLAREGSQAPFTSDIPAADLACRVGVNPATLSRTLARLVTLRVTGLDADIHGPFHVIPLRLRGLNPAEVARLTPGVAAEHARLTAP